jgi:hypothetical protein
LLISRTILPSSVCLRVLSRSTESAWLALARATFDGRTKPTISGVANGKSHHLYCTATPLPNIPCQPPRPVRSASGGIFPSFGISSWPTLMWIIKDVAGRTNRICDLEGSPESDVAARFVLRIFSVQSNHIGGILVKPSSSFQSRFKYSATIAVRPVRLRPLPRRPTRNHQAAAHHRPFSWVSSREINVF